MLSAGFAQADGKSNKTYQFVHQVVSPAKCGKGAFDTTKVSYSLSYTAKDKGVFQYILASKNVKYISSDSGKFIIDMVMNKRVKLTDPSTIDKIVNRIANWEGEMASLRKSGYAVDTNLVMQNAGVNLLNFTPKSAGLASEMFMTDMRTGYLRLWNGNNGSIREEIQMETVLDASYEAISAQIKSLFIQFPLAPKSATNVEIRSIGLNQELLNSKPGGLFLFCPINSEIGKRAITDLMTSKSKNSSFTVIATDADMTQAKLDMILCQMGYKGSVMMKSTGMLNQEFNNWPLFIRMDAENKPQASFLLCVDDFKNHLKTITP
jgi:hypothetical protein